MRQVSFHNYSVPKDDPIHYASTEKELKDGIFMRIAHCHVTIIPTGMYTHYSKWIKKEIEGSRSYGKPILAVNPWAQQRKSFVVCQSAQKVVGWNKNSVIQGIWDLYNS